MWLVYGTARVLMTIRGVDEMPSGRLRWRVRDGRWREVVGLLILCGGTMFAASQQYQWGTQKRLIRSLAQSVAAGRRHPADFRIAIFSSAERGSIPAGGLEKILDASPSLSWRAISAEDIRTGSLEQFDVLVIPGGSAREKALELGEVGMTAIRTYVHEGGGYVGICGGAFLATSHYEWGLALVNVKPDIRVVTIPGHGELSLAARGTGIVSMEMTNGGRMVFGESWNTVDIMYAGGPIVSPAERKDLAVFCPLAYYRTEICRYECQQHTMVDTPAIVASSFGNGRLVLFSPHPELTDGLGELVRAAILSTARHPSDVLQVDTLQ